MSAPALAYSNRPGCFSSIVMFNADCARCKACIHAIDCAEAVEVARIKLVPLLAKIASQEKSRTGRRSSRR